MEFGIGPQALNYIRNGMSGPYIRGNLNMTYDTSIGNRVPSLSGGSGEGTGGRSGEYVRAYRPDPVFRNRRIERRGGLDYKAEGGEVESEEEKYGVIKAPENPMLAKAVEVYRDLERRLEGSPMEYMLPGGGIAQVLERKAYGEDPSTLEYGIAGLDTADILPFGKMAKMAMFLGPAAKSGVERISQLVQREREGATPSEIWAEQGSLNRRVFRSDVDGRPRIELDTSEAKLRTDSPMFNANTPVRSFRKYEETDPTSIVGKADIEQKGRLIGRGEVIDETKRYPFLQGPDNFTPRSKGPLRFNEVIDYPSLMDEYPDIADVRIAEMPPGIDAEGMYVPATNTIHLRGGSEKRTLSTLLHEAQHWIQDYEGFPFGTAPDDIPKDLKERAKDLAKKFSAAQERIEGFLSPVVESSMRIRGDTISDEIVEKETKNAADMLLSLFKGYRETKLPDEKFSDYVVRKDYGRLPESIKNAPSAVRGPSELLLDSLEPFIRRYDSLEDQAVKHQYQLRRAQEEAQKKYSAVAGEVEARNVQARLADPTIRRRSPNETMDTPLDEIYYSEIIPPTSKIYDDFGEMKKPEGMAQGGGVETLAPRAKAMFNKPVDIRQGVGSYAKHIRRA